MQGGLSTQGWKQDFLTLGDCSCVWPSLYFYSKKKRIEAVLTQRNKDSSGNWQEINELKDVSGKNYPFNYYENAFLNLKSWLLKVSVLAGGFR